MAIDENGLIGITKSKDAQRQIFGCIDEYELYFYELYKNELVYFRDISCVSLKSYE